MDFNRVQPMDHTQVNPGDEVWAYAYAESFTLDESNHARLNQTPVFGIIEQTKCGISGIVGQIECGMCFTPYSKRGHKKLIQSKTVDAKSRYYALTERDAWLGYKQAVLHTMSKHDARKNNLADYLSVVPSMTGTIVGYDDSKGLRFESPVSPRNHYNNCALRIANHPDVILYPEYRLPNIPNLTWYYTMNPIGIADMTPTTRSLEDADPTGYWLHLPVTKRRYIISAYDKDHDTYLDLFDSWDQAEAIAIAKEFWVNQYDNVLFRLNPNIWDEFDWMAVFDTLKGSDADPIAIISGNPDSD